MVKYGIWIKLLTAVIISGTIVIIASKVFPVGQTNPEASLQKFTSHLDQQVPQIMADYRIPGLSIALIEGGETVWTQAYGYADVEAGRRMTVDTYCRLESISKSVTAWGVMQLIEQGLIDPDAPVEQYLTSWQLPATEYDVQQVTVRKLLSGTAGMPLGTIGVRYAPGDADMPTLKDRLTKEAVLFKPPGGTFYYSNTGFNILELVIEEVSGRGFAEYMQQEVLKPLGMTSSSFNWSADFAPPVANGYDNRGKAIPVYIYPDKAAGGLFGPLDDVARFTAAGLTDFNSLHSGVLQPETVQRMYTPIADMTGYYRFVFDGYGLGHFIEFLTGRGQAVKMVSHGGQGSGWMTDFHLIPETGDGIVILANSQRTWPGFAYILSDWAVWNGFDSIGMGFIITVQKIAWASIALVLALLLLQAWQILEGVSTGSRRLAPLARHKRLLRGTQASAGILLAGAFIWIKSLDYWFIDSVLPIATHWINFMLLAAAIVLLVTTLFPQEMQTREQAGSNI
ncbi:MAG: serine hydrolase domain-containing protein [Spirochaetota bacterium]